MSSEITKMALSSFYEGTSFANANIAWTNNGESPLENAELHLVIGNYNASEGTISPLIHVKKFVSLTQFTSTEDVIGNIDISELVKGTYDVVSYVTFNGIQISPSFLEEDVLQILGPQYSALINSVSFSS